MAAFTLAVFPSFVAVSRDNGVDPLLILLMLASCAAGLAAIDSGRLRTLVGAVCWLGLAFNTKSLAALLCMPGIGLGYLVCAPGSWRRRLASWQPPASMFVAVAVSWSLAVDLDTRFAAPVHRQHLVQLGDPARVRLQRLRPCRGPAGRSRNDQEVPHGDPDQTAGAAGYRLPVDAGRAALLRGAPTGQR